MTQAHYTVLLLCDKTAPICPFPPISPCFSPVQGCTAAQRSPPSHPQDTITCIARLQLQLGVKDTSLLNFVLSDGTSLLATRYVYPEKEGAASLYYAEGACVGRR